tara:strand:- start:4 stop:207 length:204 start_codon:yes stop_codon:yes gene_type:complete
MKKDSEIIIIEATLRNIFKKDVVNRIDVGIANKLFEKWKLIKEHTEDIEYPLLKSILDEEPNWQTKN